jgi:hypothetical protein
MPVGYTYAKPIKSTNRSAFYATYQTSDNYAVLTTITTATVSSNFSAIRSTNSET